MTLKVFAGSASKVFAEKMAAHLQVPVSKGVSQRFSEGNIFVKVEEDVHHQETLIVQTLSGDNVNNDLMELLFWIDALKRYDAAKITVVIPFFSYAKADKQDGDGTSIRARVIADCLQAAGASKIITMDLHSPSIPGFFQIPVENLSAMKTFADYFRQTDLSETVVVSPDAGFAKQARKYAVELGLPCVIGDKSRPELLKQKAEILEIMGEVRDKNCLIVDDFTTSAGTLCDIARALRERGAKKIVAAVAHAPIDEKACQRIEESAIEKLVTTNTIENPVFAKSAKIQVLDVSGEFAKSL